MAINFNTVIAAQLNQLSHDLQAGFARLEGILTLMPTRAEFDALKEQLVQAIQDATRRVTADIDALKNQLASGNPVTDQDLTDLRNDIASIGAIDAPPLP